MCLLRQFKTVVGTVLRLVQSIYNASTLGGQYGIVGGVAYGALPFPQWLLCSHETNVCQTSFFWGVGRLPAPT